MTGRSRSAPGAEATLRRILARLEHHPLAIRLVIPAWLGRGEDAAALQRDLDQFLASATDHLADKKTHRSLDACFRYAYEALPGPDRERLGGLSLFDAPFQIEPAAETLGLDQAETLATLTRLAGRSFVWTRADDGGVRRLFGFSPQVRPFVQRRVRADQRDLSAERRRFAASHATLIAHAHQALGKAEWEIYRDLVALTLPDLIHAVGWSDGNRRATLGLSLGQIAEALGALDQAQQLFHDAKAAAEAAGDEASASRAVYAMAGIHKLRGDLDAAMRLYEEALAITERLGDLHDKGATLHAIAGIHHVRGDLDAAMRLYEESLAITEGLGSLQGKGATLYAMAGIHKLRGDLDAAMRLYEEALAIAERQGDLGGMGATLHAIAGIHQVRGDLDAAMRLYEKALAITEQVGDLQGKGATLRTIADIQLVRGELDVAMRLYMEALAITEWLGGPPGQRRDAARHRKHSPSAWGPGRGDAAVRGIAGD